MHKLQFIFSCILTTIHLKIRFQFCCHQKVITHFSFQRPLPFFTQQLKKKKKKERVKQNETKNLKVSNEKELKTLLN